MNDLERLVHALSAYRYPTDYDIERWASFGQTLSSQRRAAAADARSRRKRRTLLIVELLLFLVILASSAYLARRS